MKELLEIIAKSLVDNPEEVEVTEEMRDDAVVLNLKVAPRDMGKVIGRSGKTAKAIRRIMNATNADDETRVIVDIG